MKPISLTISVPSFTIACEATPAVEAASRPAADSPELEILDQYAGLWIERVAGKPEVSRSDVGEWILDGRFMRQTWTFEAHDDVPKASGMTFMTYDREKKAYRSWAFTAAGSVIENEGTWDSKHRAMTWWHSLPDTKERVFTKVMFSDGLIQDWSITKTNAAGEIVREVTGRSIRQMD